MNKDHDVVKKYNEQYAKELLEALCGSNYYNLLCSDKPDIRMGDNHGIEVVWAANGDNNRIMRLNVAIREYGGRADKVSISEAKRKLLSLDVKPIQWKNEAVCGAISNISPEQMSQDCLLQIYTHKVQKCRNYGTPIIDLFIFTPLYHLDNLIGEYPIKSFMSIVCDDPNNTFSNIFVYEEPNLYWCVTKRKEIEKITGSPETIRGCKERASLSSGWDKYVKANE